MSTTKKRVEYPYFFATGLVHVHQHGECLPVIKIEASGYINFQDEAHRMLTYCAKKKLEQVGLSEEAIKALWFEETTITNVVAKCARGVRNAGDELIEAFFDSPALKKRDQFIRQRRIIPWDRNEMVELYGPKAATPVGGAA